MTGQYECTRAGIGEFAGAVSACGKSLALDLLVFCDDRSSETVVRRRVVETDAGERQCSFDAIADCIVRTCTD
jgi:hypothetical protein